MLSSVGYRSPGCAPTGGMAHASTSYPSGDGATNRTGTDTSYRAASPSENAVSRRSPTNSSAGRSGTVAVKATVPPATSYPVTVRSPPTMSSGAPLPSAATRYRWTLPASSTANQANPSSQIGSRALPNGSQLRSNPAVSTRAGPPSTSSTATWAWLPATRPSTTSAANRLPSGDHDGCDQLRSVSVTRTGLPPPASTT